MSLISARQLDLTSHLGYASGSGRQLRIASTALGDGLTGGDASVLSVAVSFCLLNTSGTNTIVSALQ